MYKGEKYYFVPNGTVAFLYASVDDFKQNKKKCVAQYKLNGCKYEKSSDLDGVKQNIEVAISYDFDTVYASLPTVFSKTDDENSNEELKKKCREKDEEILRLLEQIKLLKIDNKST